MSFVTKAKGLPELPIVLENDNLEDIGLESNRPIQERLKQGNPYSHNNTSQYSKENLHTSSKTSLARSHASNLKSRRLMTRSMTSINDLDTSRSKPTSSQYIVLLDKTPLNLTPSQRLKLRKLQLSNGIAKFNSLSNNSIKTLIQDESDDDEEIDENDCVFNVPLSQPLSSLTQKEKYLFDKKQRKLSLTTDSTRASSILSHDSLADTSSSISFNHDDCFHKGPVYNSIIGNSNNHLNSDDLNLSKDAIELTLLFNRNQFVQINEESRLRRKMLTNFKKIGNSMPSTPLEGSFSKLSIADKNSLLAIEILRKPSLQQRSISQPSISTISSQRKHKSAPSKYYTFTRPTWLPPKPSYDRRKHQKESEEVIHQALLREAKERSQKLDKLQKIAKLRDNDTDVWESVIQNVKTYNEKKETKQVKDMYWRGILEKSRSSIWYKQIGNKINLNEKDCDLYFDKFDQDFMKKIHEFDRLLANNAQCQIRLDQQSITSAGSEKHTLQNAELLSDKQLNKYLKVNTNMLAIKSLYDRMSQDLLDTYPDCNIFQSPKVIQVLSKISMSFIIYLNETRDKIEINDKTIGNLNTNYYFTGLTNIVALLYFHYKNSYKTFVSLANIFQKRIPNLLLNYNVKSNIEDKNRCNGLLADDFFKKFETLLKKNHNRLYTHFEVIGVQTSDYAPSILTSLFSNIFSFDLSSQIIDIYAFEDEQFLMKCLLGLLKKISYKLFGTKQELLNLLGANNRKPFNTETKPGVYKYLNVGYEYEFINTIKEIQV